MQPRSHTVVRQTQNVRMSLVHFGATAKRGLKKFKLRVKVRIMIETKLQFCCNN